MNFGETLTYWYLRLNGFFPISNFVLHKNGSNLRSSADCDLLAVRFPFVYEKIGGQGQDWDINRFNEWGLYFNDDIIGLIVEVKTGKKDSSDYIKNIWKSFEKERLIYAIQRLGFWQHQDVDDIADSLSSTDVYRNHSDSYVVGKLLVAVNMPDINRIPACMKLKMSDVEKFIFDRIDKYDNKNADKLRFPSELLQYIIWQRKVATS